MHEKPSANEEAYFARHEITRRRKTASARHAAILSEGKDRERALHLMKCPKCGMQLEEIPFGGVRIDKCFSCEGLWLDKGELEVIRKKEDGFMGRMLSVFD